MSDYDHVEVGVLNIDLLSKRIDIVIIGDWLFSLPITVEGREDGEANDSQMEMDEGNNGIGQSGGEYDIACKASSIDFGIDLRLGARWWRASYYVHCAAMQILMLTDVFIFSILFSFHHSTCSFLSSDYWYIKFLPAKFVISDMLDSCRYTESGIFTWQQF
jgi:hypothetical protein